MSVMISREQRNYFLDMVNDPRNQATDNPHWIHVDTVMAIFDNFIKPDIGELDAEGCPVDFEGGSNPAYWEGPPVD